MSALPPIPRTSVLRRARMHPAEPLWWGAALAAFFLFPDYLSFGTSVLIMAMLALSLGLVLGFAGVVTLGHAVFFGVGAYTAALLAIGGWTEPVTGALLGGLAATAVALATGPLLLRLHGLPLVLATLALGVVFYEAANKAGWITGGDDGLFGMELAPLLGRYEWTIFGHTQYLYALAWLFAAVVLVRRILASPFGLALEGIRENAPRMRLIGAPVLGQLVVAYAISGFLAGVAGALSAQTTAFVGLQVFALETSVDALLMLVLGGIGSVYGGLVGAPLYMSVKYFTQQWDPHLWKLFVAALLILATLIARGGLVGLLGRLWRRR